MVHRLKSDMDREEANSSPWTSLLFPEEFKEQKTRRFDIACFVNMTGLVVVL